MRTKTITPVLEMWTILMQAITIEQREQDYAAHLDRPERLPPVMRAMMDESLPASKIRDHYIAKFKRDPRLRESIDKIAELCKKRSKRQEPAWLAAAKEIAELIKKSELDDPALPKDEAPNKHTSTVLFKLISDRIDKTDSKIAERFQMEKYRKAMNDAGYKTPKNLGWKKGVQYNEILLNVYCKPMLKKRLTKYHREKKALERSDKYDAKTKQKWMNFLDKMIFALGSILGYINKKGIVRQHAYYIIADIMRKRGRHGNIYDEYKEEYRRLRNNVIVWAQSVDLIFDSGFIGPARDTCAPIFEPQNVDEALFWDYYGVPCEKCKNWRVRGTKGGMARCDSCGYSFEPRFTIHCTICWRRYNVKKVRREDSEHPEYRVWQDGKGPVEHDESWHFDCECKERVVIHGFIHETAKTGNCLRTDKKMIMRESGIGLTPGILRLPQDFDKKLNRIHGKTRF